MSLPRVGTLPDFMKRIIATAGDDDSVGTSDRFAFDVSAHNKLCGIAMGSGTSWEFFTPSPGGQNPSSHDEYYNLPEVVNEVQLATPIHWGHSFRVVAGSSSGIFLCVGKNTDSDVTLTYYTFIAG